MKLNSWICLLATTALIAPSASAFADDLLGGHGGQKGGGSGGSQSGGGRNSGPTSPPPNRDRDRGGNQGSGGNSNQNSGSGRRSDPINVPDRGNSKSNNNEARTTRTGRNSYQGSNNGRSNNGRDIVVVRDIPSYSDVRRQARNDERVRVVRNYDNCRVGYVHYDPYWSDRNFGYGYYGFRPNDNCVFSPWYSYSYMPGYVSAARLRFDNCWHLNVDLSFRFDLSSNRRTNYNRYDRDVDMAVRSIDKAFDDDQPRYLDDVVGRRSWVTIRSRWERPYTISSDDYYDMMADLIETSRTKSFHIRDVRTDRSGSTVRVLAEHIYYDAWRNQRSAWHSYTLEGGRNGYQIVEFAINDGRFDDDCDWRD